MVEDLYVQATHNPELSAHSLGVVVLTDLASLDLPQNRIEAGFTQTNLDKSRLNLVLQSAPLTGVC